MSSKLNTIHNNGVFTFLAKMLPLNIPLDDLKLLNKNYRIGHQSFINPFIETNKRFKKTINIDALDRYSSIDAFYSDMKSLQGEVGDELTSVVNETINFDSDSDDYSEMITSLALKIDALKESVDDLQSVSETEKQIISSALLLALNFAKAKGLPLISIALAFYLSAGTSSKLENGVQSIENKVQSSTNRIEQNQINIIDAINIGIENNDIYYEHLKIEADSLKNQYLKIESKMDSILQKLGRNK